MATHVEVKEVAPQSTAAVRYSTPMENMGQQMGQAFGKVMAYVQSKHLRPSGMPFSTYPSMAPDAKGNWQVISGMPVSDEFAGEGEVEAYKLPGGKVAVATHMGPYDTLPQTYTAMENWLKEHDLKSAGQMWEYYFTDPEAEPDTSKWRTDIYMPVANT